MFSVLAFVAAPVALLAAVPEVRIPASTHNLPLDARVSGNLESFDKGLRGAPGHDKPGD